MPGMRNNPAKKGKNFNLNHCVERKKLAWRKRYVVLSNFPCARRHCVGRATFKRGNTNLEP